MLLYHLEGFQLQVFKMASSKRGFGILCNKEFYYRVALGELSAQWHHQGPSFLTCLLCPL